MPANFSHEDLLRVMRYEPETGFFYRALNSVSGRPIKNPSRSGSVMSHGYREVSVFGNRCTEHRLAWFYCYGVWPIKQIDHINGNRQDNRISNLREATCAQNTRNRFQKIGASGVRGVYFMGLWRPKPWNARIRVNYRTKSLGYYFTREEASSVYEKAAREVGGEFYCATQFDVARPRKLSSPEMAKP